MTRPGVWTFQRIQQLRDLRPGELWPLNQRSLLMRNSPDSPVFIVSTRITKVMLGMIDYRIIPISNIQRPVRSDLQSTGRKFVCEEATSGA